MPNLKYFVPIDRSSFRPNRNRTERGWGGFSQVAGPIRLTINVRRFGGSRTTTYLSNGPMALGKDRKDRDVVTGRLMAIRRYVVRSFGSEEIHGGESDRAFRFVYRKSNGFVSVNVDRQVLNVATMGGSDPKWLFSYVPTLVACGACHHVFKHTEARTNDEGMDECPGCGDFETWDLEFEDAKVVARELKLEEAKT